MIVKGSRDMPPSNRFEIKIAKARRKDQIKNIEKKGKLCSSIEIYGRRGYQIQF